MNGNADPGPDSVAFWSSVALAFLLGFGVLAAATAFPLHWMPGQLPVLVVVLFVAPLLAALMRRQAGEQVGPAVQQWRQRAWMALAFWIGLLVLVAALDWRLSRSAGSWQTSAFMLPLLVSVALCVLSIAVAGALTTLWQLLAPQAWEARAGAGELRAALDPAEGRRLDRSLLMRTLWRWWVAGAVLLAGALVVGGMAPRGGAALIAPWGVLALAGYCGLGMVLIGHAARRRWSTQWRLEQLGVSPDVLGGWGRNVAPAILLALFGGGLLLAVDAVHGAHVMVVLGWQALLPLLNALLAFFAHIAGAPPPHIPDILHQAPAPRRLPPATAPPQATTPAGLWLWLAAHWPLLCSLLALVVVALLWRGRARSEQRDFWRSLCLALLRELRLLWLLLWRPAHHLAT
ncbi:MAG TPA: hypothetical protein VHB98_20090, partial [Chloroflexota bacterium]|nr:hypothetical protein [Chloroflexota bacterium]